MPKIAVKTRFLPYGATSSSTRVAKDQLTARLVRDRDRAVILAELDVRLGVFERCPVHEQLERMKDNVRYVSKVYRAKIKVAKADAERRVSWTSRCAAVERARMLCRSPSARGLAGTVR